MALIEYGWWDQSNHCLHTKKVLLSETKLDGAYTADKSLIMARESGTGSRNCRVVSSLTVSRKMVCNFWIFIALPFKRAARKMKTHSTQDARKIHVTCISA
jgi:hypothetical protein